MKYKAIIFDMDNTLTPSKSPIEPETASLLSKLLGVTRVVVTSGASLDQFQKQLIDHLSPEDPNRSNLYLLPTNGVSFFESKGNSWNKIYSTELSVDDKKKIAQALEDVIKKYDFLKPENIFGSQIEDRVSQITYAGLGQQAPLDLKRAWDPDQKKRLIMKKALEERLEDFSIVVAGTTSVDITPKGMNKAFGLERCLDYLKIGLHESAFVGDALYPGGNDAPVLALNIQTYEVSGPHDTRKLIAGWIA